MQDILSYPSKWLRRSHVMRAIFSETELPVLPQIIRSLENLLSQPKAGSGDVAILLESDPVIAGRVVHLANSAYYGSGRNDVASVSRAVSRLGMQTVRSLVYAAALPELFHSKGFAFNHKAFWRHSLTVAFLTRDLVLQKDKNAVDTADHGYLAGLMHDLGILLFAKAIPEQYDKITTKSPDIGRDLFFVEEQMLGIDHSEVGANFIERNWKIDPEIVQGVRLHHNHPKEHPASHPYSEQVFVANAVCSVYGITNGALKSIRNENLGLLTTLAELGWDFEQLERLITMANENVADVEALLEK